MQIDKPYGDIQRPYGGLEQKEPDGEFDIETVEPTTIYADYMKRWLTEQ